MPLPLFLGIAAAVAGAGALKKQIDKSKELNDVINLEEQRCADEAKQYGASYHDEPDYQRKLLAFLIKNAYSDLNKQEFPPFSDWGHLTAETPVIATRKYSLISWGEYAFYTEKGVYYHNKRKGIHDFLFYSEINNFDITSGIVDYGNSSIQKNIAEWENFEKQFVNQICCIKKTQSVEEAESLTSVFQFCFNHSDDFRKNLQFFETSGIKKIFKKHSQNKPRVIQENWDHIMINKVESGKIELQYWQYFANPTSPAINENDTEYEIAEKQREAERRQWEAERKQLSAESAAYELVKNTEAVIMMFRNALYELYGFHFEQDDIIFMDYPNFTFEGQSFIERVEGVANTVISYANEVAERNNK